MLKCPGALNGVGNVVPFFFFFFFFCFNGFFLLVEIWSIIYPTSGILLRPTTARSLTCKKVLAMFVLNLRCFVFAFINRFSSYSPDVLTPICRFPLLPFSVFRLF